MNKLQKKMLARSRVRIMPKGEHWPLLEATHIQYRTCDELYDMKDPNTMVLARLSQKVKSLFSKR